MVIPEGGRLGPLEETTSTSGVGVRDDTGLNEWFPVLGVTVVVVWE